MSRIFRRPSAITCFFCQSNISPAPVNTRSFRCPHCATWNRYDAHGEIISDEAAMHEEALNVHSFAKRGLNSLLSNNYESMTHFMFATASPSKSHLPPLYGAGPFCHTCQTNQMMAMNLLSNYLPDPTVGLYVLVIFSSSYNVHKGSRVLSPLGDAGRLQGFVTASLPACMQQLPIHRRRRDQEEGGDGAHVGTW
jgi:hypothetical protein